MPPLAASMDVDAAAPAADDLPALKAQALAPAVAGLKGTAKLEAAKKREAAIGAYANALAVHGEGEALAVLLTDLRPYFPEMSKAKTAKVVRQVLDALARVPDSTQLQLRLCKEQVEWAREQKRTFLKQRIELRLATLHLEDKSYQASLELISELAREVKKLDDKLLLVDIHLLESKIHHSLRNLPKSKAALTAARTNANAIYVPPSLQAQIDTQAGTLSAEEKDYKTAYSYFFEAFEQHSALGAAAAPRSLKYMLMCKVMSGDAHEVPAIVQSKAGLRFEGDEVDSLKAIAKAFADRSLSGFQGVLERYSRQLSEDMVVASHLRALYDTMMEKNLCKILEPYERISIAYVADIIKLDVALVERKLSQMILDKKFLGTLDQGSGYLIVYESHPVDPTYTGTLELLGGMGKVVESLQQRSAKILV